MYMWYARLMEVPISQFRRNLFSIVEKALDGKEVWVKHKGRRVRLLPENQSTSKLSRITPMEIIAPGVNFEDSSWKSVLMSEWERKWDRRLGARIKPPRSASRAGQTSGRRKAQGNA